MSLNASTDAALRGAAPLVVCALRMALPDYTIKAVDGAGAVSIDGEVYTGEDAVYGTLSGIEVIEESQGTEAPSVRVVFLPRSTTALANITNPAVQGSEVQIPFAVLDATTGSVIGDPELLFLGELDSAEVTAGRNSRAITFEIVSAWDRFFDVNEGARQTSSFHRKFYPDELGFDFITGVDQDVYWGYYAP